MSGSCPEVEAEKLGLAHVGALPSPQKRHPIVKADEDKSGATAPRCLAADDDRFNAPLGFLNGQFFLKVSASDTDGNLTVYDTGRTERGGPPMHLHHSQDEWFFVREGQFVVRIGDVDYHLGPGDSILAPRNIPHAFANVSNTGRLMIMFQPAGTMEAFFTEASLLTDNSPPKMQALFRAHGMEITGPPLNLN